MNAYVKQNIMLPISLHDARVTKIIVNQSSDIMCGSLRFEFEQGFYKVEDEAAHQTGKSFLEISGIDYDFSHVYYYKGNQREAMSFNKFAREVEGNAFEIMDETYGYNKTKLSGLLMSEHQSYDIEIEIEIYHFNASVYTWED